MPTSSPFGCRILASESSSAALAIEKAGGLGERFQALDALVTRLLRLSLEGERIAMLTRERARGYALAMPVLEPHERAWLDENLSLERLRSQGLWELPDEASLEVGVLSLPWALEQYGRFGAQMAAEERSRLALDTPEAIFVWSTLVPLFRALYRPIELRTLRAGEGTREEQVEAWEQSASFLADLGFGTRPSFDAIRYGSGWPRLRIQGRHEALSVFVADLRGAILPDTGGLFRCYYTRPLVEKYYARAKGGVALKKRVVTAALRPALVAPWSGSYAAFVDYLGERLHPDEHVITAKPDVELSLPSSGQVESVAAEVGLPADAVAAVAAAAFGEDPVGPRVACMKRFWASFDDLHARQESGMRPLWGLVDGGQVGPPMNDGPYQAQLFRDLLDADLNAELERLWSGQMWPRFPERILTEWTPHATMAAAFGPALQFWEGVALTAWFVCEGPSSRTDLQGLRDYHAREVAALEDLGTPVDPVLLRELTAAESRLGPPQEIWDDHEEDPVPISDGISITVSMRMGWGIKREGFEILRDIITRHRRAWAERYLDVYLQARWEREIEGAGEVYLVLLNQRQGKPPTLEQFAKKASDATNHWLGGDVGALYRLIKEKCPEPIVDARRVVGSPHLAAYRLHEKLVSIIEKKGPGGPHAHYTACSLLRLGQQYVQWLEGSSTNPSRDRIKDFSYYAGSLSPDADEAWELFVSAVEVSVFNERSGPPPDRRRVPPSQSESRLWTAPASLDDQEDASIKTPKAVSWWRRMLGR